MKWLHLVRHKSTAAQKHALKVRNEFNPRNDGWQASEAWFSTDVEGIRRAASQYVTPVTMRFAWGKKTLSVID